jgi:hypothetical protein
MLSENGNEIKSLITLNTQLQRDKEQCLKNSRRDHEVLELEQQSAEEMKQSKRELEKYYKRVLSEYQR